MNSINNQTESSLHVLAVDLSTAPTPVCWRTDALTIMSAGVCTGQCAHVGSGEGMQMEAPELYHAVSAQHGYSLL